MTTLTKALGYARRGLHVLPIRERGKEPLTEHGVHDATTDPATIRAWFERWPTANVAIAVPFRFFVVDVDPKNGGGTELARLERKHGDLPDTITARSGSGGEHRLFARPSGVNLRGKLSQGIDLLGVGRYFLVAPSVHPCGGDYKWTSARGTEIAQPPEWLVELARARDVEPALLERPTAPTPATVIDRARRYVAQCDPAVSGQGGRTTTFVLAQRLVRGFGLSEAEAFALMVEWNRTCVPPWSRHELVAKIKEAIKSGRMEVGALRDAPMPRRSA